MKKTRKPNLDKPLTDAEWNSLGKTMHGISGLPKNVQQAVRNSAGRPRVDNPKERVTVRLDPEILAALRAQGKGWQTRMNEVLKAWAKRHPA